MQKLLITGAMGFLGRNILEIIDYKKYEVWIICRVMPVISSGINVILCDLEDRELTCKIIHQIQADTLLMLAWDVSSQSYWESKENYKWADISITMAKQFMDAGGRQIMFAGTSASYDYNLGHLKESKVYEHPDSIYGQTKLYTSREIHTAAEMYGIYYCEARLFSLFGKYERLNRLIPVTIQRLVNREEVLNTKGDLRRDYISAYDAAKAMLFLMEKQAQGTFNISSGEPISIREIVLKLGELLDRREYIRFKLNLDDDEPRLIVGDNSRLLDAGFQEGFCIEERLKESIEWMQRRNI